MIQSLREASLGKRRPRIGRPRTLSLRPAPTPAPALAVDTPLSLPPEANPVERPIEPADDKGLAPTQEEIRQRQRVMTILAMRVAGIEDEEIARQLGIVIGTLRNCVYLAGKKGWLTAEAIASPVEQIEYTLLHKVVRNLDASLDSNDKDERYRVTDKLFDSTLARHWAPVAAGPAQTLVAIRIENPPGPPQQIREGTVQGVSAWTEGEGS